MCQEFSTFSTFKINFLRQVLYSPDWFVTQHVDKSGLELASLFPISQVPG